MPVPMLRRLGLLAGIVAACLILPARSDRALAQGAEVAGTPETSDALALPGLDADARAFTRELRRAHPAGLDAAARRKAEESATQALARKDYPRAVSALESVLGGGRLEADSAPAALRQLARAELARRPARPARALAAAWLAFQRVDRDSESAAADQVAALQMMREALAALDRPAPELAVMQALLRRQPGNTALRQELARRQQQAGLLVRGLSVDAEAFPARACIAFLGTPSEAPDFVPGDWVTLDPPVRDAAVTLESQRLCVSGLPAGATTRLTLRAGMPGEEGLALKQATTLAVALPDRAPQLLFDGARYLQPRGAPATVALRSVNLSAVKLRVVRIAERNLVRVLRAYPLGTGAGPEGIDSSGATNLENNLGRVVWTGSAEVAGFSRNALVRTVLPLPEPTLAPGLYALIARPGDGTPFADPDDAPAAVQLVLRTDLAPTVWHGAEGDTVQVRSYATGQPLPTVAIDLLAANNEILATATTDPNGLAHFDAPLLEGSGGMAPAELHLRGPGGDFTRLALAGAGLDLGGNAISGEMQPGPIDPFLWTDRGIYRPGETVQVMALLRNEAGVPVDLPLHLIVTRPDGRVFSDTVPPRTADAALHLPLALSPGAPRGTWTIALRTDPKGPLLASCDFQVDAFVPPRLAVAFATPLPAALAPGQRTELPLAVRFLYGAPGGDLAGNASLTLEPDPTPFAAYAAYRFGLADDPFSGTRSEVPLAATDAAGETRVPLDLAHLPDTSRPLRAVVQAVVDDPAGRSVAATATLPIRPAAPLIGIAPAFSGDSIDAGTEAAFRLLAVDPEGKRVALPVSLRLVRQTPQWRLTVAHGQARYETIWRDEPVDGQQITLSAEGEPFVYRRALPAGRYRLQVVQVGGGMAASSVVFFSGWAGGADPDVPAHVTVRADRQSYKPGDTAHLRVEAPWAGPAAVVVMTDRVKQLIDITPATPDFTVDVPVTADWGPGAYVGVHVFRPGNPVAGGPEANPRGREKEPPARAIGVVWLGLDPAPRTLPLALDSAPVYRPRTSAAFAVKTAPGAWVTLAAVDEGILGLTGFATPAPLAHYFGKRMLGVDIHDDWARLLAPAGPATTTLRQGAGGDEEGPAGAIPQKIVSLFAGPVQADKEGVARFTLDLPDFAGTLRLMAVGWNGAKTGSLGQDVLLRDPAVVEPLLPRFLAPGDTARAAVLLHNLELPAGRFTLHVAVSGSLTLSAPPPATLELAAQQRLVVPLALTTAGVGPNALGTGTVEITVDGPEGFHVAHSATLEVHPARAALTRVAPLTLAPGASQTVTPDAAGLLPGSWQATASFGGGVRYDPAPMVRALEAYPLDCLEQLASRGLALAMLGGEPVDADRMGRLQRVVSALADRQRYDGSFGLWSAEEAAQPWLSAYATDVLLRARKAGAEVPAPVLEQALGWLASEVAQPPTDPDETAAQAYALYVLALAGKAPAGAVRVAAAAVADEPTPLARAQIAAALARLGQADKARAIFAGVLADPARKPWSADFGSALRDALAGAVLAAESGTMAPKLADIRARLPGADLSPDTLNTQEQAWAVAAAAALGANAPPISLEVGALEVDGKALAPAPRLALPLPGPLVLHNPGTAAVSGSVAVRGVPLVSPPAARAGMELRRAFFTLDGRKLAPDKLTQNTAFVMVLEGRATDGQAHQAMVLAGLPAGWEIAGQFPGGKVAGMDWLGSLSAPDRQSAADDRYAAALSLSAEHPDFRLAVVLRAVTPGSFEAPAPVATDMYRPGVFARLDAGRVTVAPAGH